MNDYVKDRQTQRKREYHRKWRAEHQDSVRASQMKYWSRKLAEMQQTAMITADAETRNAEV